MKSKYKQIDNGLIIQLLLVIILVIFLILSIFWNHLFLVAEILSGITLVVMGFNNQRIYKRKYLTAIYMAFGGLIFLSAIWSIIVG